MYFIESLQDAIRRRDSVATMNYIHKSCKKYLNYELIESCADVEPTGGFRAEELTITPYSMQSSIEEVHYIEAVSCAHFAKRGFLRKKEGIICSVFFEGWVDYSEDISSLEKNNLDLRLNKIEFRGYGSKWNGNKETTLRCFKKNLHVSPKVIREVTLQELIREVFKKRKEK